MKKFVKVLLYGVLSLLVIIGLIAAYIKIALPNVGDAPDITIQATPEKIERGRYLANHVMVCMDCHSTRDWTKFSGPITAGTLGKGGERFDQTLGFPGVFYAKNITPYKLKDWTDGEIFRAITTGVNKDGKALFPIMPYHYYGQLDEEDIYAVIAYIRTLQPIEKPDIESVADFPFNFILNTIPQPAKPKKIPPVTDTLAYGQYLVTAAACVECHSKEEKGKIITGTEYGGGRVFKMPWGTLITPNITAHATGIGAWSKEVFIKKFKQYLDSSFVTPNLKPNEYNTIMSWTMYAGMTEQDLGMIYEYLRTVPKINNQVEKFKPL